MRKIPNMVNMARTLEEKEDAAKPYDAVESQPDYPYGLSLCFTQDELDKLDLDDDVSVGDYIHLFAFAKVTSVSKTEVNGEQRCRVEMTLTHIAAEDEDSENEEYEEAEEKRESRGVYGPLG